MSSILRPLSRYTTFFSKSLTGRRISDSAYGIGVLMRRDVTAALRLTLGHLMLRKSRLESFCVLVVGVLLSRTVNLSHLACMFPTQRASGLCGRGHCRSLP